MIKFSFYLILFIIFGCNDSNLHQKDEQEEIDNFFENFVALKKDYDFKEIKYVSYGDSLALHYWIEDSRIDTVYLKKYIKINRTAENYIAEKRPAVFKSCKDFDIEDFYKLKRKNPDSNFNEYFSMNFKELELLCINFLVFNHQKDRALIYYSINQGVVEVYKKQDDKWFLLKTISRAAM